MNPSDQPTPKPSVPNRALPGDLGPCLYFGPAGQRCDRRATRDGFCQRHQPGTPTISAPFLTPKKLAAFLIALAMLWPELTRFLERACSSVALAPLTRQTDPSWIQKSVFNLEIQVKIRTCRNYSKARLQLFSVCGINGASRMRSRRHSSARAQRCCSPTRTIVQSRPSRNWAKNSAPKRFVPCDVQQQSDIDNLAAAVKAQGHRLDAVVHCLAFANHEDLGNPFVNTSRAGFQLALEVSAFSLVAVSKALVPLMSDGGAIMTLTYLGLDACRDELQHHGRGQGRARSIGEISRQRAR